MHPVNIVLAFDEQYQNMAEVLLKSLCCYHQNMAIFIVSHQDLNTHFKQSLYHHLINLGQNKIIDLKFVVIDMNDTNFKDNGYISKSTYLRYYIEYLFPLGYSDNWLYLDVDMLVVRNIFAPFEHPEFENYALACVSDIYVNKMPEHVAKFGSDDYFNAGVLYINAKKWKNIKEQLIQLTDQYRDELQFGDQDVLNLLFKDAWLKLPKAYNTQFDHQLENTLNNQTARILHFTGAKKPIHYLTQQPLPNNYPNLQRYQYYSQLDWTRAVTQKSVAVISSTIGRPELERAILSVRNQTYPCKHYIFVDGEQHFDKVKPLQDKYPDVIFTFLPMNTGANGWTNSYINAIAPFLIKEDIICHLDDDNWYDTHHIQSIINGFNDYEQIDVVYNLRRFFTEESEYLCDDDSESLGFFYYNIVSYELEFNQIKKPIYTTLHRGTLVDTNCLAMTRETARELAQYWTHSQQNDSYVWKKCLQQNKRIYATGQRTVNYILNTKSFNILPEVHQVFQVQEHQLKEFFVLSFQAKNSATLTSKEQPIWCRPYVYINGEILAMDK